jgi:hypothetical protein
VYASRSETTQKKLPEELHGQLPIVAQYPEEIPAGDHQEQASAVGCHRRRSRLERMHRISMGFVTVRTALSGATPASEVNGDALINAYRNSSWSGTTSRMT